ncbi:MAG: phage tail protein [Flavisolibacter sp.]|nr:phage tail protein [Flavisolibacter sp.]
MGNYPLSKYHFTVHCDDIKISFSEVSGLSMELAVIEYREGSSEDSLKMPGIRKYSNITLKRGVQKGNHEFFDWINTVRLNTVERRNIVISLLDDAHQPVLSWRVKNAWPCKYEVADLLATGNEVLIESLELAHDGLEVVR